VSRHREENSKNGDSAMARTAKPATRASKKADPKHAKNDNPDAEIEEGAEEDIGRPAPNLALSEVQVSVL
jgi:hypothetical protein